MEKINGMIDRSKNGEFCREYRGYFVYRNYYGMYTTMLKNYPISAIMCDTVNGIKRAISHDIHRGKAN